MKKTNATAPHELCWHPDFRDLSRLPDVKVVRTAFFINSAAILAMLIMGVWFGFREFQLHDLNRQIAEWQRQIDRDRFASAQAVVQFKKFQLEEARFKEVEKFVKSKPVFSEVLLHLAETLPASAALDSLDFSDVNFTLRGVIRGTPDLAAGYASNYLQQLKTDPVFLPMFADITLSSLTQNPQSGQLQFEIKFRLKEVKKP